MKTPEKLTRSSLFANRMRIQNHGNGFTLLEVMIALTLFGMIVVIVTGALRIGIRAWEKGEKSIEGLQAPRIALDMMRRQLSSFDAGLTAKRRQENLFFKGNEKQLEFVTLTPIRSKPIGGPSYIAYRVVSDDEGGGEHLDMFLKERPRFGPALEKEMEDPNSWHMLIPSAQKIFFEYLKKEEKTESFFWMSQWDGATQGNPPHAVKIIIKDWASPFPLDILIRLPELKFS